MLEFAGQKDEALQQCHETLRMDPWNFQALDLIASIHRRRKSISESRKYHQLAEKQAGSAPSYHANWNAGLAAAAGDRAECLKHLAELENLYSKHGVGADAIGRLYAVLGEKNLAFDWAIKACDGFETGLLWIKVNEDWNPLRDDPRYKPLLTRLGL